MRTLPDSLSRRGIANEFDKLTPVAWERLFDKENQNGIARLRVPGDMNNRVYYSVEGIAQWLVRNDYYKRIEIRMKCGESSHTVPIRQHVMAG